MRVLATTAYPEAPSLSYFLEYAQQDQLKIHTLVNDPELADIIIFVDPPNPDDDFFLTKLFDHPWLKHFWYKFIVYNERDEPFTILPGLYTSLLKSQWNPKRHRPCVYLQVPNQFVGKSFSYKKDLLGSFMGSSRTHPLRKKLLSLNFSELYLEDTTNYWFFGNTKNPQAHDNQTKSQKLKYAEIMARSKFVLCPRGKSPSSFRVYEALMSGAVPVIISDEWIQPDGPNWQEFCIFVPENNIENIENIVQSSESKYEQMVQLGKMAYNEWLSPNVRFHHMIESASLILKNPRWTEQIWQNLPCKVYAKRKIFYIAKTSLKLFKNMKNIKKI
ncbi:Exostosin family protein (plasmid) [Gloeothece citriformis PCC 7424]|uniref:Exostosin family protein n=1 Tax=Gloeothece citriformis (strain PCC 7424) TaxID=65393 RepID=B7KM29_GLOC7|nr:exostosin family protein [Gloeothece citriformis]ACK73851.1 Exostosin family protein [Gloeothece citriformis PCC 7424]